jgi:hypothetical protein
MPAFIHGLKLSRAYYMEAVRPILDKDFPGLAHAAGLIDGGSEVLGYDDEISVDHDWGPRFTLFLTDEDLARHGSAVQKALAASLPYQFRGYPTNFTASSAPDDEGVQLLKAVHAGPVNHGITIESMRHFFLEYLGFEVGKTLEPADWLTFPQQCLLTITAGQVFHDAIGLQGIRERFSYYPRDVWLYLLASGWARIGQEEHLMGRAGVAGDEIGSGLIAARLVRDIMRLCFLMEKKYTPYAKWMGTAFQELRAARSLQPILQAVLNSRTWQARQRNLVQAYANIAARHNALKVTRRLPEKPSAFHGRPFLVIAQNGFTKALIEEIHDPAVCRIARRPLIGSIDMLSDNVDLVSNPSWRLRLRQLYA